MPTSLVIFHDRFLNTSITLCWVGRPLPSKLLWRMTFNKGEFFIMTVEFSFLGTWRSCADRVCRTLSLITSLIVASIIGYVRLGIVDFHEWIVASIGLVPESLTWGVLIWLQTLRTVTHLIAMWEHSAALNTILLGVFLLLVDNHYTLIRWLTLIISNSEVL